MKIDKNLYTLKYAPDTDSHLHPKNEDCKMCEGRPCTFICPAEVYEWNEDKQELMVNFENCLECGACRIACDKQTLIWDYPKQSYGVTFKQG